MCVCMFLCPFCFLKIYCIDFCRNFCIIIIMKYHEIVSQIKGTKSSFGFRVHTKKCFSESNRQSFSIVIFKQITKTQDKKKEYSINTHLSKEKRGEEPDPFPLETFLKRQNWLSKFIVFVIEKKILPKFPPSSSSKKKEFSYR